MSFSRVHVEPPLKRTYEVGWLKKCSPCFRCVQMLVKNGEGFLYGDKSLEYTLANLTAFIPFSKTMLCVLLFQQFCSIPTW